MPNPFGSINTIYNPSDKFGAFNRKYEGTTPIQQQGRLSDVISDEQMDEGYEVEPEQTATFQGGMFSDVLGPNVDIYDPESIAAGLTDMYGFEPGTLTPSMFPAMSKQLMAATQASTYDPYKKMLAEPEEVDYRQMIASAAGMLNPNKQRQRAMRMYKAGMGDISRSIFAKTSMAREGVRDWLQNALAKVKRMKY